MSDIQENRRTAIIYYCHCGQRIILTSGEPAGVAVVDSYDRAYCLKCGKSLGSVWESLACSNRE